MNRIGLLLVMSLLCSVINPAQAALPASVITKLKSYKKSLETNVSEFIKCVKGDKDCDPQKKKVLKIGLAIGGILAIAVAGGIGFYYWNKKQQSHQDQKKKQTKPDTQARSDDEIQKMLDDELNIDIMMHRPITRIRTLINAGANVNGKGRFENTPLANAVNRSDSNSFVPELLNLGARVNEQSHYGNTALMLSITDYDGNYKTAKILLDAGADVNIQNKPGETALMKASMHNSSLIVKELLKAGADPDMKSNNGKTAIDFTDNKDIQLILLEASAQKAATKRRTTEMETVRLQQKEPTSYLSRLPVMHHDLWLISEIEKRIKATDEKEIAKKLKEQKEQ